MTRQIGIVPIAIMTTLMIAIAPPSACTPKTTDTQIAAATIAHVANDVVYDLLKRAYDDEGLDAIAKASSRADAEAALVKVREHWKPVWAAWDALAHNDALLHACMGDQQCSDDRVLRDVIDSWCLLRIATKDTSVKLPDPVKVCAP